MFTLLSPVVLGFCRSFVQTKWFTIFSCVFPEGSKFYRIKPYMIERRDFAICLATSGAFYASYCLIDDQSWLRRFIAKIRRPWVKVGEVSALYIHPIKSCRGVQFTQTTSTPLGLQNNGYADRTFCVMNSDTGKFVTSRPRDKDQPRLVLVVPKIEDHVLRLNAEGMKELRVDLQDVEKMNDVREVKLWRDLPCAGYDCGDAVSEWLAGILIDAKPGQYRLVWYKECADNGRWVKDDPKYGFVGRNRNDKVAFADLAPYLLATESSFDDLSLKMEKDVTMRHYRPNIVVRGSEAYDEHNWSAIKIGEWAKFLNVKPCGRCISTTVDPETAATDKSGEPLSTLRKFRSPPAEEKAVFGAAPYFGINLLYDSSENAQIAVGDPVFIRYK